MLRLQHANDSSIADVEREIGLKLPNVRDQRIQSVIIEFNPPASDYQSVEVIRAVRERLGISNLYKTGHVMVGVSFTRCGRCGNVYDYLKDLSFCHGCIQLPESQEAMSAMLNINYATINSTVIALEVRTTPIDEDNEPFPVILLPYITVEPGKMCKVCGRVAFIGDDGCWENTCGTCNVQLAFGP